MSLARHRHRRERTRAAPRFRPQFNVTVPSICQSGTILHTFLMMKLISQRLRGQQHVADLCGDHAYRHLDQRLLQRGPQSSPRSSVALAPESFQLVLRIRAARMLAGSFYRHTRRAGCRTAPLDTSRFSMIATGRPAPFPAGSAGRQRKSRERASAGKLMLQPRWKVTGRQTCQRFWLADRGGVVPVRRRSRTPCRRECLPMNLVGHRRSWVPGWAANNAPRRPINRNRKIKRTFEPLSGVV